MIKAIFYKEWIKTKWIFILSALALFGFASYLIFNVYRMIELKGAVHIWEVMIQRDVLFIDMIRFVPPVIGILFAITQFVPEMQRKCLKLTLHLPCDAQKIILSMVGYGAVMLLLLFSATLACFYVNLRIILVEQIANHIILSSVVWFLSGILAYLLTAWCVLEPTWKRRILNAVVSILLVKIFFYNVAGEAYNSFLPILLLYTAMASSFVFLSVSRFKEGKQD